jgi:hypothetical protein
VPCYRCGTRQADPEPGKPSPYHRGVVDEHQVLICPACQPAALADLTRCPRCGGVHLIRRLDQVECLDCRLIRAADSSPDGDIPDTSGGGDSALTDEVARALERMRETR